MSYSPFFYVFSMSRLKVVIYIRISFYSIITRIQFSVNITSTIFFTKNPVFFCFFVFFFKSLATCFEQITSVHCEAASQTENQKLQFVIRSKKLLKLTKNCLQKFKQCDKTMWQKPIQTDIEGRNVCCDLLMVYLSL